MHDFIKQAIKREQMLEKGMSKVDLDKTIRDIRNLINYAIKLEKRVHNFENPKPEKYY